MSVLDLTHLAPGFADPIHDSQRAFRAMMNAMARPGLIQAAGANAAPAGLDEAATAIALTLFDPETPVWLAPDLREGDAETFLRFHCGCPIVGSGQQAAFALASGRTPEARLDAFNPGSEKYPDRSTTVVLMCAGFSNGPPLSLTGPGVKDTVRIAPMGLADDFVVDWQAAQSRFQLGIDVFLTCGRQIIGLPRTLTIEAVGS
jgi:alpha-D-ribose 1-methylphosphonate 5-triphosphate synthase subunit PhnH